MKWYEKMIVRWVTKRIVIQDWGNDVRITQYYRILHEAARAEYTEDPDPSLKLLLLDCFEAASRGDKRPPYPGGYGLVLSPKT